MFRLVFMYLNAIFEPLCFGGFEFSVVFNINNVDYYKGSNYGAYFSNHNHYKLSVPVKILIV